MARDVLKPNSGTKLDNLSKTLRELRETKSKTRQALYDEIFYCLGMEEKATYISEAFLIKTADKLFGKFTTDADTVLMALGLLEGYDYNATKSCKQRRIKFLKESTYLAKKGKDTPYEKADEELQSNYEDSLRATDEPNLLLEMADFMLKPENHSEEFMSDIDKYIDDGVSIYPIPGYIKRKPLQDRIKTAAIKYVYLDGRAFIAKHDILINRNNECEIEIDLSKKPDEPADEPANKPPARAAGVSALCLAIIVIASFISNLHGSVQDLAQNTIHDEGSGTIDAAGTVPDSDNVAVVDPF